MGRFKGFSRVQLTRPQRSDFDLSHFRRTSTGAGRLTPCLVAEAIPGDTFNGDSQMLLRLAPLLGPLYDGIMVYIHFFFVAYRNLYSEWETFITGGRLGVGIDPVNAPIPPYFELEEIITDYVEITNKSCLLDYMGVPPETWVDWSAPGDYDGLYIDALPILAYNQVWYEYYRDRNFVADDIMEFPYPSGKIDLSDVQNLLLLETKQRAYAPDYFNSALPFLQRGQQVLIPLDGQVTYLRQSIVKRSDTGAALTNFDLLLGTQSVPTYAPGTMGFSNDGGATEQTAGRIENIESISNGTSTIADFRSAYALQVWLERNAVGGSRYSESTEAHFGVRPQDSRLQRPEYLGGGRVPVRIQEIVSTAYAVNQDDETIPQANLAGKGTAFGNTNGFRYFCPEHGIILGIMSIMYDQSYHQGIPKMYRRRSFLDYPWPTFAKLGEQQVDKLELFASKANMTEDSDGQIPLFGYQSRYADWKFIQSTNSGEFHDTLLFWTLTQDYSDSPELGTDFTLLQKGGDTRIFAVNPTDGGDNYWIYLSNKLFVRRCLPYFGTPNTLGFA